MEPYPPFRYNFLLNESPIEELNIQEIEGMSYYMIPVASDVPHASPPHLSSSNFAEEYHQELEENGKLTETMQELLAEREVLLQALSESQGFPQSKRRPKRSHKRERRTAGEITRHFQCEICGKAYGSEGSLKQHIQYKHQ